MRSFIRLIVTTLLITTMVACSGGGGSTSGNGQTAPADSATPADTATPKPAATSDSGATDNPVNNGVTIVEKPTATTPPAASDIPASTPVEKQPDAAPLQEAKPDPMVASITAPQSGSLWLVDMSGGPQIFLTGTSNKKDATYTWAAFDAKGNAVDISKDASGAPFFSMKTVGSHTITLAGNSPDGTSNSASVEITGTAPSLEDAKLNLTGLSDGGFYPLGTYPLMAVKYSDPVSPGNYQYTWSISKKPEGSNGVINGTTHYATFTPDIEGTYQVTVAVKNAAGDSAQKSITLNMLPVENTKIWSPLGGGVGLSSLLSVSTSEMYAGTANTIYKYGSEKQWMPILIDPTDSSYTHGIARVSENEVYFGGTGYVLKFNGSGFTKMALPTSYKNSQIKNISATTNNLWVSAFGSILKWSGNEFVTHENANGQTISGNTIIVFSSNLIVATNSSSDTSYVYHGDTPEWIKLNKADDDQYFFDKCTHGVSSDPIVCISKAGRLYTLTPDSKTGFGAPVRQQQYEPLPTKNIADVSFNNKGTVRILDTMGQFYTFDPQTSSWTQTKNIISPTLNTQYSNLGSAPDNAPALINGTGEIFGFNTVDLKWTKEQFPEEFTLDNISQLPNNGTILLGGYFTSSDNITTSGGILHFDPVKHKIVKYEKLPTPYGGSIFANNLNDIWVLGNALIHFDGTKWTTLQVPEGFKITSSVISGSPDGTMYLGGTHNEKNSFIKIHGGKEFMASASDYAPYYIARFVSLDDSHVYAFGKCDLVDLPVCAWKLDADGTWKSFGIFKNFSISDGVVVSPNDITVAGDPGAKHFNGTSWSNEGLELPGYIKKLSAIGGEVWGLVAPDKLYKREAQTATWKHVSDLSHNKIAASLSTIFMLDPLQFLYAGPLDLRFVGVVSK